MRTSSALIALAATACATTTALSARGRQVAVLSQEPGPECVRLGVVTGGADPLFGGTRSREQLVESARNDAINQASDAGATAILFQGEPGVSPSGTFGGKEAVAVFAAAFRCGAPPPGCTKDTDCKGTRVCDSGRCVEPSGPAR